jgi:hypothetical protein
MTEGSGSNGDRVIKAFTDSVGSLVSGGICTVMQRDPG